MISYNIWGLCIQRMSVSNEITTIENEMKSSSGTIGLIVTCITFIIPLGLYFSFVYSPDGSFGTFVAIFLGVLALGCIANILFYRSVVLKKSESLDKSQIKYILKITSISFMVLLLTMFAIGINPGLIKIFENTIGIWFLGIMGNNEFINEIFSSEVFSGLKELNDSNIFNYNFLLTRLNETNIDNFIEFFKKTDAENKGSNEGVEFPFDFKPKFETEGQLSKLRDLVETKRTVGYFTWVYLTSIVSLMISIISITMKT